MLLQILSHFEEFKISILFETYDIKDKFVRKIGICIGAEGETLISQILIWNFGFS